MTDIKPVLNCKTPRPSLLGSRFCDNEYACSHTAKSKKYLEPRMGIYNTRGFQWSN